MFGKHINAVFDVDGDHFQASCACGWISNVSFLEEVDLLRALHAHGIAVYGETGGHTELSVAPHTLSNQSQEGRGV